MEQTLSRSEQKLPTIELSAVDPADIDRAASVIGEVIPLDTHVVVENQRVEDVATGAIRIVPREVEVPLTDEIKQMVVEAQVDTLVRMELSGLAADEWHALEQARKDARNGVHGAHMRLRTTTEELQAKIDERLHDIVLVDETKRVVEQQLYRTLAKDDPEIALKFADFVDEPVDLHLPPTEHEKTELPRSFVQRARKIGSKVAEFLGAYQSQPELQHAAKDELRK